MKTLIKRKIKRHLIAHGDYASTCNCHVKSPVILLDIFKIFGDILEFLCIYSETNEMGKECGAYGGG